MPKLRKSTQALYATDENTSVSLTETQLRIMVKPQVQDIRALIDRAVTEDDWLDIIRVYKNLALAGDKKAADFLAKYRFGLPAQMVQHSGKIGTGITIVEVVRKETESIIEGEATEVND